MPLKCHYLRPLEHELAARGVRETFRGQAWSSNCREWIYFDCWLDLASIRARLSLPPCVEDHEHRGTHDGSERGFVCRECQDAVMGLIEPRESSPIVA